MAVFKIVLIKPSHYDARGYVIQWWRSTIPSNSLASVYGLLTECADAQVLGPDVDIDIDAYDECNTIIDIKGTIRKIRAAGAGFVGLLLVSAIDQRQISALFGQRQCDGFADASGTPSDESYLAFECFLHVPFPSG